MLPTPASGAERRLPAGAATAHLLRPSGAVPERSAQHGLNGAASRWRRRCAVERARSARALSPGPPPHRRSHRFRFALRTSTRGELCPARSAGTGRGPWGTATTPLCEADASVELQAPASRGSIPWQGARPPADDGETLNGKRAELRVVRGLAGCRLPSPAQRVAWNAKGPGPLDAGASSTTGRFSSSRRASRPGRGICLPRDHC